MASFVAAAASAATLCCCFCFCCLPLACGQRSEFRVGVQHNATLQFLQASNFSSDVSFTFSHLVLNESQLLPANAASLLDALTGLQAVIADFHIMLAVATYGSSMPYFITSKFDFSSIEYRPNMFKFEIDATQLNETLFDVSSTMRRNGFIIFSDTATTSDFFMDSMAGKAVVHRIVSENTTDAEIYGYLAAEHDLLEQRSWVLLFGPANMAQIERIFNQSGLAGRLGVNDVYFIPSLEEKQHYLEIVRLSDAVVYTFELVGGHRLSQQQLHEVFLLDCFRHLAESERRRLAVGRSNYTLLHAMQLTSIEGVSGHFAYNGGRRGSVSLSVMGIDRSLPATNFLQEVGRWRQGASPAYQINYGRQAGIRNSIVRFAAILEEPYIYRNDYGQLTGISLEIMELMRARLGFKYTIEFVDDSMYGAQLPNGSWTGIMKYLTQNRADISCNFMATTPVRLRDVDSSINLMQSGIQMMLKREIHQFDFFHVFYPFSWFVWLSILFSMFILAGTLWVSDKISPNVEGKSIFSMMESFFLVFSSFLMSKVETNPQKPSARLFTLLLWFSTLFYMTTYVSNLVAFLVKPDDSLPFSNVEELVNATSYRYGFVAATASHTTAMTKWPQLVQRATEQWPDEMLQTSVDASIRKVREDSRYVYVESAATLRFQNTKFCDLRIYGSVEEVTYETMLIRKGFKYAEEVRNFLKSIQYNEYEKLERKYFSVNRCPTSSINPNDKQPLGFSYFVGIFALVGVGAVLGFLYILLQWIFKRLYEVISRSRSVRLKYGEEYEAEVLKIIKDGIWVRVKGQHRIYFIANNSLHSDPTSVKSAKSLGLHPGDTMKVQYFGKDEATQNRIFARLNEQSLWYQEQHTAKDESDSE